MQSLTKSLRYYLTHPMQLVIKCVSAGILPMPDKIYIKILFRQRLGYHLDLENPQTYNEKIQWLKLYDRNPRYVKMVDKYEVKQYVADKIGEAHIIPTLGVWDSFDEIDFESLPEQFVLKCTHDSGGIVIVKDKSKLNIEMARKTLEKSLKTNYYLLGREWAYKNVPRRILAEKYMFEESEKELKDYKVFNFNGTPKLIQVDYDRFKEHKRNLYTTSWEYINNKIEYPTDEHHLISKPECLESMLRIASILSEGIPHVRSDFYIINNQVYFGELTFYHGNGFEKFSPEEFGYEMGKYIQLPPKGKNKY